MTGGDLAAYQEAERQAAIEEGRRGLKAHTVVTVLVSTMLVVVNVTVASGFPWAIFAVGGMGIGLAAHWYGVTHSDAELRKRQADIERRTAA